MLPVGLYYSENKLTKKQEADIIAWLVDEHNIMVGNIITDQKN